MHKLLPESTWICSNVGNPKVPRVTDMVLSCAIRHSWTPTTMDLELLISFLGHQPILSPISGTLHPQYIISTIIMCPQYGTTESFSARQVLEVGSWPCCSQVQPSIYSTCTCCRLPTLCEVNICTHCNVYIYIVNNNNTKTFNEPTIIQNIIIIIIYNMCNVIHNTSSNM